MRTISFRVLLGLALAAGLLLRIVAAANFGNVSVDGVYYLEQARSLVSSGVLPFCNFAPGWPLVLSIPLVFMDLSDPMAPLRAAQIANVILGAVMGLLTFLMVARRLGRWAGLLAAAVILLLPLDILLSRGDLSEMTYACCLVGSWLLLDSRRRFAAGLLLGFAYVVRPEAMLIVAALGLWCLIRERRVPWTLVAGVLVFFIPYVVFARYYTGHWTLSGKSGFLWAAIREMRSNGVFSVVGRKLPAFARHYPQMAGWPVVVLSVLGLVVRPGRRILYLLPLAIIPFFDFLLGPRYWVPYLPFLLLAAGTGTAWVAARLPAGRRRLGTAVILVLALAGTGLASRSALGDFRDPPETYPGLKAAGLWLRENVGRETVVAAHKPFASHWGWCRFAKYQRSQSTRGLVRSALAAGAEYLVVNNGVARNQVPGLRPFTGRIPPDIAGQLTLVQSFRYEDDPGQNTDIYRVNQPTPAPENRFNTFWVQARGLYEEEEPPPDRRRRQAGPRR